MKHTCDLGSRSFPIVAWHQGQHAGCSTDTALIPKKSWRQCGGVGITFQSKNKLTALVHCTILIFAGRKESDRCESKLYIKRFKMWMDAGIAALMNNDYRIPSCVIKHMHFHTLPCDSMFAIFSHESSCFLHAYFCIILQGCIHVRREVQPWERPVVVMWITESAPQHQMTANVWWIKGHCCCCCYKRQHVL